MSENKRYANDIPWFIGFSCVYKRWIHTYNRSISSWYCRQYPYIKSWYLIAYKSKSFWWFLSILLILNSSSFWVPQVVNDFDEFTLRFMTHIPSKYHLVIVIKNPYEKAYYYRWIHLTIHDFVSHMSNLLAKLLTNWLDSVMHKSFRVN